VPFERDELIAVNRGQSVSEEDDFTVERYAQFVRYLPKDVRRVVDLGCNTGRGGVELRARLGAGVKLVGVDVVEERLAAVPAGAYDELVCAFGEQLPMATGSVDAIVCGEVIEHVPGPQVMPVLHEAFRVLRLGGRLLVTTPNPRYWKNRWTGFSVLGDPSHVSQHTPASLRRKLEDAGFVRVKMVGSGRLTRRVGERWLPIHAYGSYLAVAEKR